jgi:hypothetical protein
MPNAPDPIDPLESERKLAQENLRLRSRLAELEEELSRRDARPESARAQTDYRKRRYSRSGAEFRELSGRAADQAARLVRGAAMVMLEQVDTAARSADAFTSEVRRRNRVHRTDDAPERPMSAESGVPSGGTSRSYRTSPALEAAWNLPFDFLAGAIAGLNTAMEFPRRAAERFLEALDEEPAQSDSRQASLYPDEPVEPGEPFERAAPPPAAM